MIPGVTYVASLWQLFSFHLLSGFCGILWQLFYPFLTKEAKDICFPADKNIARSIKYTAWSDIKATEKIALGKAKELLSWIWFYNIKCFWLEDSCFKQLVDDISPKPYIFYYFTTFKIKYFHTNFTTFNVLLLFMALEYSLMYEVHIKLFQKAI